MGKSKGAAAGKGGKEDAAAKPAKGAQKIEVSHILVGLPSAWPVGNTWRGIPARPTGLSREKSQYLDACSISFSVLTTRQCQKMSKMEEAYAEIESSVRDKKGSCTSVFDTVARKYSEDKAKVGTFALLH